MKTSRRKSHHPSRLAASVRDTLHRVRRGYSDRVALVRTQRSRRISDETDGHLLREHSIAQRAECQFRAYTDTVGCGCDSVFSDGISAEQQRSFFRLTGQRLRAPAHP